MHPGASGEHVVEARRASQGSSAIGDVLVVDGLRRSWCIMHGVLWESERRTPREGGMHRARSHWNSVRKGGTLEILFENIGQSTSGSDPGKKEPRCQNKTLGFFGEAPRMVV